MNKSEPVTVSPKPRHKSKTHIFNVCMGALTTAEANLHVLQPLMGADVYAVLSFVTVVGNVVLRELTKGPVQ